MGIFLPYCRIIKSVSCLYVHCCLLGMNQQQLQQILTVAAVVAPIVQNSQQMAAANQMTALNQQNQPNLGTSVGLIAPCAV